MHSKNWLVIASLVLGLVSGCGKKLEKQYCTDNLETPNFEDELLCCREYPEFCQPGGMCETATDCSFETPICSPEQVCVGCLQMEDCMTGARPVCDETSHACVGCRGNPDCPATDLCLSDGSCAAAGEVAYVSQTGTMNDMCSKETPCQNLSQALSLIPARKYIKVTGEIDASTTISAGTVTIYGTPGMAILTRKANGPVLEITKAANVTLVDLQLVGSPDQPALSLAMAPGPAVSLTRVDVRSPNNDGILITEGKVTMTDSAVHNSLKAGVNVGGKGALVMDGKSRVMNNTEEGIKAAAGSTVEIRHSFITGNRGVAGISATNAGMVTIESSVIALNTSAAGASISGPLSIRNSVFAGNGATNLSVGGLFLDSTNATFEFNTVADNISSGTTKLGMSCVASINVSSSIFSGNTVNGCSVTYSLADTLLSGTGNKTGAPRFKDTLTPMGSTYYRIDQTSDARDSAGPSSILDDIDGDPRPATGKDMGADEFK